MLDDLIEVDPPRKLVTTFRAKWSSEVGAHRPSRCTWKIIPFGGFCKLTLVHDDVDGEMATSKAVTGGWPETLSRLKTLLEPGVLFSIEVSHMSEPLD